MSEVFLYRRENWIKPGVWAICLLILAAPGISTFKTAIHYFDLKANTRGKTLSVRPRSKILIIDSISNVFESLSVSCRKNGAFVRQVDVPKTEIDGKLEVVYQQITMGGGFIPVLKSLNDLAQNLSSAKIGSIAFERHDINHNEELVTTVIFERVKLPENYEK